MHQSPKLPMELTAEFTLDGRRLVMNSNGAVYQMQLAVEAAEWIWQDILRGGDRRERRAIPEAKAFVTDTGIQIQIGTLLIFRTMNGTKRGILVDKQELLIAGKEPAIWQVVQL